MAIAFVNVGAVLSTANANNISVPYPAGLAAGNALLLCVANSIPKDYVAPSGWTLVQGNAAVGSDLGFGVFSKIAAGTETGTLNVVINSGVGTGLHAGVITCHSGVSGSPFGTNNVASTSSGATTSPALTALSPGANDWVVRFYMWAADSSGTGITLGNPGGTWVSRKNQITNVASSLQAGNVTADKQAGIDSQTITSSVSGAFSVVQVVLVAGAAAGGPIGKVVKSRGALVNASTW